MLEQFEHRLLKQSETTKECDLCNNVCNWLMTQIFPRPLAHISLHTKTHPADIPSLRPSARLPACLSVPPSVRAPDRTLCYRMSTILRFTHLSSCQKAPAILWGKQTLHLGNALWNNHRIHVMRIDCNEIYREEGAQCQQNAQEHCQNRTDVDVIKEIGDVFQLQTTCESKPKPYNNTAKNLEIFDPHHTMHPTVLLKGLTLYGNRTRSFRNRSVPDVML